MPESHIILLQRYSLQRAICKQCSVFLAVVILLIGALGRLAAVNLLWAAAPLVLLGLAEAGYAAQERRCAELVGQGKEKDESLALLTGAGGVGVVRTAFAALSFSIWPFYLGLIGIVVAGSRALPVPVVEAPLAAARSASSPAQVNLQTPTVSMPFSSPGPQLASRQNQPHPSPFPQVAVSKPPGGQNLPRLAPMNTAVVPRGPLTPQASGILNQPHAN